MKIKKRDRDKAIKVMKSENGYNDHEALQSWLQMSAKEQRKFVAKIGPITQKFCL
jgi:hypothetical protein